MIATRGNPEEEQTFKELRNVTILKFAVTDVAAIQKTVPTILQSHSVDVVLNNAVFDLRGPLEALTDEQILLQVQVNLQGAVNVTRAFIS